MRKPIILLVLAFIIGLTITFWWFEGNKSVDPNNKEQKIFVIEKGAGVREIGKDLKEQGLIKDPVVFFLLIKKENKDTRIQAGDYRLSPSMNLPTIIDNLTHGTLDIWITVKEGLRANEIAQILKENFESYEDEWVKKLNSQEGYLFPDTYLIPKDAGIELIISIFNKNFHNKISSIGLDKDSSNLKRIVIIASIIEREARFPEEKDLVSSVIYNRLDIGMPLQVDASVQYALPYDSREKSWWKKHLTVQDLKINSSYNTYTNIGLPPTPIANPGVVSLKSAASPATSNYLYYVSDRSGHLHFAKTLEEHNINIDKYIIE